MNDNWIPPSLQWWVFVDDGSIIQIQGNVYGMVSPWGAEEARERTEEASSLISSRAPQFNSYSLSASFALDLIARSSPLQPSIAFIYILLELSSPRFRVSFLPKKLLGHSLISKGNQSINPISNHTATSISKEKHLVIP